MERRTTTAEREGGLPQTPPASARSGLRRWMPTVLGVVAGLALCVGAVGVAHLLAPASPPAPSATEATICADLTGQHYDALYGLLAPNLAAQGNAQQFAATQAELDALGGKVTTCAVASEQVAGQYASARLALTRAQAGTASASLTLTAFDGQWKISAYDTAHL